MKNKHFIIFLFLQFFITFPFSASAARLTFQGTVLDDPPCIFNSGAAIVVDFGPSVMTTRVNGINYIKDVNYNLECTNPPLNALRLQIKGLGAGFDIKSLSTNKNDLAISFYANGQEFPVNQWFNFTNLKQPEIRAVPIKNPGSTLTGGAFIATATMMIEYQ